MKTVKIIFIVLLLALIGSNSTHSQDIGYVCLFTYDNSGERHGTLEFKEGVKVCWNFDRNDRQDIGLTKLVFEAMDLMSGHREIYDIEIEKDQYRAESKIELPKGKYRIFITDPVTNRILGKSELFEVKK